MSIIEYLIWQCDTSLHLLTLPPQYNKGLYCVTALQAPMKSGCVIGNSQVRPLQKIENGHEAQQTSVQKQAHLSFSFQF